MGSGRKEVEVVQRWTLSTSIALLVVSENRVNIYRERRAEKREWEKG